MSSHIPIMRNMGRCSSLIPVRTNKTSTLVRSSISIGRGIPVFIQWSFPSTSDGSGICSIRVSDIGRSSVVWERIRISLLVCAGMFWLALPELALWRPSSVSVVWRWSKSFLFLVMADESEFDGDGEEKKDSSNDGYGESSSLQATCGLQAWKMSKSIISLLNRVVGIHISRSEWGVDISFAAGSSASGRIGNIDESSTESKVKEHSNKAQECNTS